MFAAIFVEGVGIPAPGQTLLVAAALLAGRGEMRLAPLLATAFLAAALGNAAGWLIGRHGGRPFLRRFAQGERLARLEGTFQRSSAAVLLLSRFVDGARQLNGIAAGALGVPWGRFVAWSSAGALLWSGSWALGAYAFGRDLEPLSRTVHRLRPVLLLAVPVACAGVVIWLFRRRRNAPPP